MKRELKFKKTIGSGCLIVTRNASSATQKKIEKIIFDALTFFVFQVLVFQILSERLESIVTMKEDIY